MDMTTIMESHRQAFDLPYTSQVGKTSSVISRNDLELVMRSLQGEKVPGKAKRRAKNYRIVKFPTGDRVCVVEASGPNQASGPNLVCLFIHSFFSRVILRR